MDHARNAGTVAPGRYMAAVALVLAMGMTAVAEAGRSFAVEDFGARADGVTDAGPGIRAAIEAAKAAGPGAEVVLGAGVYRVVPEEHLLAASLVVEGARGLTLRGQGEATEIVVASARHGGILLSNCTDSYVRDLVIDHDPLPFTQGVVTAVDRAEGWFDLDLEAGYPLLSEPYFGETDIDTGRWGMIFDPVERRLKAGAADHVFIARWEGLGERRFRLFPKEGQADRLAEMEPGDRFVHMARHGKGAAVFFLLSRECGVEDVTVYASQSLAVGALGADRLLVRRLRVTWRPGTTRLISADADGVHCQQNLRGPVIEDCRFEGMADDGINIYYYPNTIVETTSPQTIRTRRGGIVRPGDLLEIHDSREGRRKAQVRAAAVEEEGNGDLVVTLERPVEGIVAGPDDKSADVIFNMSRCGRGFVIRNNRFRDHRRHAMMIKAPGGIIEDNHIEGVGADGIVIGNDAQWPEGVAPNDVAVRNNRIENIGYSKWYGGMPMGAAIQIKGSASKAPMGLAADYLTSHITLEGNRIVNPPGAGIAVGAARDILVVGNRIEIEAGASMGRLTGAVALYRCAGVRIVDLEVRSARPETTSAVTIDATAEAGPAGVAIEDLRADLVGGAPPVEDRRPNP